GPWAASSATARAAAPWPPRRARCSCRGRVSPIFRGWLFRWGRSSHLYGALRDQKEGGVFDMVQKVTVTDGEFAGWQTYDLHGTFDQVVGPFYFRPDPDGRMRCAFRAEPKHMNAGGRMHGGCLMTFADIALFQTAYQEMEGSSGVTVQLDSTFIDGAYVGELVEATGEVIRAGKSLIFVRGQINAGERVLMTFSGVIRKFMPRR